jgi:2-iminobutanoate/2-iminopropanoate deaminase
VAITTTFPPPARIFVCIPEWTGPFDIEIDCVAMV